jgi:hypothetical protein
VIKEYGAFIKWHWEGHTEELDGKNDPLPLSPSKIPRTLAWIEPRPPTVYILPRSYISREHLGWFLLMVYVCPCGWNAVRCSVGVLKQGSVDWRNRSKCCRKRKGPDVCASREYFFLCDSCRLTARDAMWETIHSVWVDVEFREPPTPLLSRLDAAGLAQRCRKLYSAN